MATLIKRPNSPYWIACFDVPQPDGSIRRLKKSTKAKNHSDAVIEAVRLEELEKKGALSTSDSARKAFAVLQEAAEAASRGELSEGRSRELLARLSEISTGSPLKFYTVRTWADAWLAMKAVSSKPATQARYKSHADTFIAWMGERADAKLEVVTKADMRAFREAVKAGWQPPVPKARGKDKGAPPPPQRTSKTVNHYTSDIAGMFRAAVREGLLLASPAAALGKLPEHDSTEREVFTVAEVGQLVEAAGDSAWQVGILRSTPELAAARCADWQGMILVGFYAGARLGDCARLTWGNVDLARKALSFMPAKTSRRRKKLELPLHPRLVAWLKEREVGAGRAPLFPTLFNTRVGGSQGLSTQFNGIMTKAGIDRRTTRQGTKGGQRAQHARSFHALRHSLTSTLANLDVSEEIRRRIVGHESAEVHAGYTHTERETLARALEKMPSV